MLELDNTTSKELTAKEFYTAFDSYWHKMSARFFKFERLQTYQEPENPSFRAFQAGNMQEAVKLISEARASNAELYTEACRKDVSMTRVRGIELPLSDYLKWEFKTYQVSARYGERILVAPINRGQNEDSAELYDFCIFDSSVVLILHYDTTGLFQGATVIDQAEHVSRYVLLSERLIGSAVPLAVFERDHKLD